MSSKKIKQDLKKAKFVAKGKALLAELEAGAPQTAPSVHAVLHIADMAELWFSGKKQGDIKREVVLKVFQGLPKYTVDMLVSILEFIVMNKVVVKKTAARLAWTWVKRVVSKK